MSQRELDELFMRRALIVARRGVGAVSPNPLVGCVIVSQSGEIIGEGAHLHYGEAHAEPNAILDAESKGHDVRGATAYVTLEPHSHQGKTKPCSTLLIEKGIARCVAAMEDPYREVRGNGFRELRKAGVVVDVGLLEQEARELNRFFIRHVTSGMPYVTLKLAMSLDGRSGLANGQSRWITSEASRKRVHELRAEFDAVMIGARTAIVDDPSLTVRHVTGRQPFRIVLDAKNELPSSSTLLTDEFKDNTIVLSGPLNNGRINLPIALRTLADQGIASILVEAGPTLAASLLQERLVDELLLFTAPTFLGGDAMNSIGEQGLTTLDAAPRFRFHRTEILGDDLLMVLRP